MLRTSSYQLLLLTLLAAPAHSQLVTPKTVPVFQDEQFALYPSSRPGMSGVSIVIDDTLADPFVNPARTARLRGLRISTAPYSHSISGNRGGGRTIPATIMYGGPAWSAFVLGAFQEIDRVGPSSTFTTSGATAGNAYYSAGISRSLHNGIALGASAFHADLGAVDGVDLLYPGSDRIAQSGSLSDFRLGATKEWAPGQVLDVVLVRNATHMRHDVHFTNWTWTPPVGPSTRVERSEVNLDDTEIYGVHTKYVQPYGTEGWRFGIMGTANRLQHPKIPNYVLQSVPRDPGYTNAFNIGIGAGREMGRGTFAAEFVLEPMSSHTWADMTTDFARGDGSIIKAGEHTMENVFSFRNGHGGISGGRKFVTDSVEGTNFTLNFGLAINSISYDLLQNNVMTRTIRGQHEHWVEAGPSFGVRFVSKDAEFSYSYRAICGSGDCISFGDKVELTQSVAAPTTGGIIAAPSAPLRLQSGRESSHHFTVSLPIR